VRVNGGVWLLVCLFLAASLSVAQSPNGTVSGIVLDPSGGLIVGADVLIINNATGIQYPGKANSEGYYVVPNVPPGTYRIQVSNSGFKTIIKPDIVVHVDDALAINFTLPIGAASEIVTVEGGAPLINTENASVSTVIDRNFVESLPLNGRSFNTLLQLTPGVVIAQSGPGTPGQFSIAGQRTDANSFTVDGVSANFGVGQNQDLGQSGTGGAQAFSALGGTSSLVSVDALQEFRIQTSSFAPEFGRMPGGQVILTTRSGTNAFHGGVFDYFRNTVMDANDWFANAAGDPRAPEHHNDFGGFLGGPIWKDRTFFFFSYEGARLDLPQTTVIRVPSEYARMTAPATVAPYLNAYPLPTDTTITPGVYTASFTGNYASRATLNATSLRIDHTFNDRFSIFGRYNYAPSEIAGPQSGGSFSLSSFQTTSVNTQTMTLGVNMMLSPRSSNTIRGNYSTQTSGQSYTLTSFGGATPLDPSLLLGPGSSSQNDALFYLLDSSYLFVGNAGVNRTRQANVVDDLTISIGSHQLKFGGDYRGLFLNVDSPPNYLLYEVPSTQAFVATGLVPYFVPYIYRPAQFLTNAFSFYGQDTWKATARLNLTYGLRWELDPAPIARGKTTLSAWENVNNPASASLAPSGTPLWATTYRNFAPRFGVAYSLTPKGDFVVRAGAGIFYDTGVGNSANLAFEFPNSASSFIQNVPLPISNLTPYLPTISLQTPYEGYAFQGSSPNLKLPRSYQWNVALEKSFGGQQAISVTYVGQAGRDLIREEALPLSNSNFNAGAFLYLTVNDARSNYNALQIQYRRPLASRLQALLNYTWSHSLDNASNDVAIALSNTIISGATDYASSVFDVRQSFSGALSYDVPAAAKSGPIAVLTKDWSLNTVIVARTGFPFNAVLFAPSALGEGLTRPDLVPGQPFWVPLTGAPGGKILNINAFSIPSTPTQGTEGRNNIPGFGLTQVDFSLGRRFTFTERLRLQFRADAFNLLNHPNFTNPSGYIAYGPSQLRSYSMLNQGLGGLNPLFQEGGPRSLQLSLKLTF
jgi:Carboxypeptidase regulatory-like domain/TonB dependent receptor/TonB-dependent Receptor Plug Domain